jgi:hypothetical protein
MATTAHPPASLGPAPRFGMGWVTWRQHRAALAGACGVLALMIYPEPNAAAPAPGSSAGLPGTARYQDRDHRLGVHSTTRRRRWLPGAAFVLAAHASRVRTMR